jgi:PST family polysaccharide transporter
VWPSSEALRQQFKVSRFMLRSNLLNYANRNVDNLLVGRYLGPVATGLYVRSYSLLRLPVSQVTGIFNRVMVPTLATLRSDKRRVQVTYLELLRNLVTVVAAAAATVAVVAGEAVPLVLGDRWAGAVPIIRVFALLSILQVVAATFGWVLMSHGEARSLSRLALFNAAFTVSSFVVGILLGTPLAVASAYAVGCLLSVYPSALLTCRAIDIGVGRLLAALARPLLLGVGVAGAAMVARAVTGNLPDLARLTLELAAAAAVFLGGVRVLGLTLRGLATIAPARDGAAAP